MKERLEFWGPPVLSQTRIRFLLLALQHPMAAQHGCDYSWDSGKAESLQDEEGPKALPHPSNSFSSLRYPISPVLPQQSSPGQSASATYLGRHRLLLE